MINFAMLNPRVRALLHPALRKNLEQYPLGSQEGKQKDAICMGVLHFGNIRWYILEGQPNGGDYDLHGIEVGFMPEPRYDTFSAGELTMLRVAVPELRCVQSDWMFAPTPLSEIKDAELQVFLSNLYDNNKTKTA